MADDQFIPLYCTLACVGAIAAGLAVWLGMKLREGTLHLLGPRERAPADDYIVFSRTAQLTPELEPASPLVPE